MKLKYLFEWLRPKNAAEASVIKHRIAMVYAFFGWNSFIYLFYLTFMKDKPTDPQERKALILERLSKGQKCYTFHVDGLTLMPSKSNVQGKSLTPPNLQADTMGE
ncbi:uncharacterized protein LOC143367972 [Andrena cerasifolii]|uniref:uncharacterized protein LOC143367972 n=1 Tax=Andrena cerasifolii TaxID=2819439 RepID=UPI004037A44B